VNEPLNLRLSSEPCWVRTSIASHTQMFPSLFLWCNVRMLPLTSCTHEGVVCGNTYLMKPSERDPIACMALVELFKGQSHQIWKLTFCIHEGVVCGNTYLMKPTERDPTACMALVELFKGQSQEISLINILYLLRRGVRQHLPHEAQWAGPDCLHDLGGAIQGTVARDFSN
jgi:hypothetical protein